MDYYIQLTTGDTILFTVPERKIGPSFAMQEDSPLVGVYQGRVVSINPRHIVMFWRAEQ